MSPRKKTSPADPSAHRGEVRSKKPLGLPTRGKTAPNRLRATDTYLALCHAGFLRVLPGWYVDLGFGETPQTTLESAARLRRVNPDIPFLGVELDPKRAAAAQSFAGPGMVFRRGGFNLPLEAGECAAVIRAMNVLRQYPEGDYRPSVGLLMGQLCKEGLLLEGTSDPPGRLMAFNLYRRAGGSAVCEALIFAVRLRHPFSPRDLQAVLPKNYIHHAEPGGALDAFFGDWEECWRRAFRQSPRDPRRRFRLAARALSADCGHPVDGHSSLLSRGFLRLTSPPNLSRPAAP